MKQHAVLSIIALVLILGSGAPAALWNNPSGGNWNGAANWTPVDGGDSGAPDTFTENAQLPALAADYVVTLTQAMYPGGLSLRTLSMNSPVLNNGKKLQLDASGTAGNPLVITLGTGVSGSVNFLDMRNNATLNLDYVTLDIDSSSATGGYQMYLRTGNYGVPVTLNATHSTIINDTTVYGGAGNAGMTVSQSTQVTLTDSQLTITRPTKNSAGVSVGSDGARLTLNTTPFEVDTLDVGFSAIVTIANAGVADSTVNRNFRIASGTANLNGGVVKVSAAAAGSHLTLEIPAGTGWSTTLNVAGGTALVQNSGELRMNPTGAHPGGNRKVKLNLSGNGAIHAQNALVGGTAPAAPSIDDYQISIADNARLLLAGNLILGTASAGNARLLMSGGTLAAAGVAVGSATADAYLDMSGGTALVGGTLTLQQGASKGARSFRIGPAATMVFTGGGMAAGGSGGWLIAPADWDTSGTLVFDPVTAPTTQGLLAFGTDMGAANVGFTAPFSIGTLDVTGIAGNGELLLISPAGNFASNALYINNLLGLDTTLDGLGRLVYIDSTLNLYYDASGNRYLGYQDFDLLSGGKLLALNIPEPASLPLLLAALAGIASRRQRRNPAHVVPESRGTI